MGPALTALLRGAATKYAGTKAGTAIDAYLNFSAYKEAAGEFASDAKRIFNALSGKWIEMQDIAFQTGRSMAMSREMAMRYDRQLMQNTKDLARQYGITAKEIADFQKSYAEATGRNVILTRQQTEAMAALSKITDSTTAAALIDEFDKVGVGITRATANVGLLQERAKALGVSPAKATKMMADNIKLAASYSFKNGVADIEQMAIKSASLRMDMDAIMSASGKFLKIEDAISTAANIQMLGGSFAQQFSNPMGAMYEANADPKKFQERLLKTIAGKGSYDKKTGMVTFDPVTMAQMRAMAEQLGISVDKLTNPAMAEIQNDVVEKELQAAGKWDEFSKIERDAIKNLSRTNVDEKTGKHYVTYVDKNGDKQKKYLEELTKDELQIAQDRQMSEEGLFSDVQDIKDILERTLGRARGTTSTKENLTGLQEEFGAFIAQLQNIYMPLVSGGLNGAGFQPWDLIKRASGGVRGGGIDWGSHATEGLVDSLLSNFWSNGNYAFAEGGIIEPIPHAAMGTIVPGDSYMGDKTPIMANAGEMVLNQKEQRGLFDLLKNIAMTGTMIWGGNKLGKRFGMGGLGAQAAMGSLLSGGGLGPGSLLGTGAAMFMGNKMMGGMMPMGMGMRMSPIQRLMGGQPITLMNPTVMMNGQTIMNGNIGDGSIVDSLEEIADAADTANVATRSFSSRLRDLSKRDTFLGRRARGLRNLKASRLRFGRKISNGRLGHIYRNRVADAKMLKANALDWYDNSKMGRFGRKGKDFVQQLGRDTKSLFGKGTATATGKALGNVGKASKLFGSAGKALGGVGKLAGPIGAVLAVGSAMHGISNATSDYDAQIEEIERSGMSKLDQARAKDKAAKQKNANIGGSVGSAAGAAIGGSLGLALGPLGAIAGGWLGEKAGGFLGKTIGGLFGGGEEAKVKKEQEEKFGKEESVAKTKSLESIEKNVAIIAGNKHSIGARGLKSPSISEIGIGVGKTMLKATPLGLAAEVLGKTPIGQKVGNAVKGGIEALPIVGGFMKVKPFAEKVSSPSSLGGGSPADINLNISGTIKLEGGGKSVDFDLSKLIDTPEFKRQLADIVTKRINENSNSGKRNMESERNNMASQYNRSGK